MTIAAVNKQAANQQSRVDNAARPPIAIGIATAEIVSPINRGIEQAAIVGQMVPITIHVTITSRRVGIIVRNPHPVGIGFIPVTRLPSIFAVLPRPVARGPEIVFPRGGTRRACIKRRGGFRQKLDLLLLGIGPEAWHPLETSVGLLPFAGNPIAARRHIAPHATHPQKIFALAIPHPIAGNPLNVLPLGLLLRRQFIDRCRRLLGDDFPVLLIEHHWLGERLMNRPLVKDFGFRHLLLLTGGNRWCWLSAGNFATPTNQQSSYCTT